MSQVNIIRWVDGKVLTEEREYSSFLNQYAYSISKMLNSAFDSMTTQGFPVYTPSVALNNLKLAVESDELFWFVGPSWIGLVGMCEDWHSPTRTLAEEIVGPRFGGWMDLEDYLSAMTSLATQLGATDFQIGMLANPRKQAMLRRLTSLGMVHTTSIVSRRVNNG